jgi:hypothetical protein
MFYPALRQAMAPDWTTVAPLFVCSKRWLAVRDHRFALSLTIL